MNSQNWKEVTEDGVTHLELEVNSPKHGKHILKVDVCDLEAVKKYKWYIELHRTNKTTGLSVYYAMAHPPGVGFTPIRLHRYLMQPEAGYVVDHKQPIGIDCRRSNMRIVTQQQNCRNNSAALGVAFQPRCVNKPFMARIDAGSTQKTKCFADVQAAWSQRRDWELQFFGETNKPALITDEALQRLKKKM